MSQVSSLLVFIAKIHEAQCSFRAIVPECRTWQRLAGTILAEVFANASLYVDDLYLIKTPGTVSAFLCSNCPASVCEHQTCMNVCLEVILSYRSQGTYHCIKPRLLFSLLSSFFFAALRLPNWMISHGEWRNMHCEEICACDRDSRGKECGILVWNVSCFRGAQRHNTLQTHSSGCHVYAVCVCLKLPNMVRDPLKLLTSIGECLIAHFKSKNSGATQSDSHLQQNVQPFCTCSRYGKI